MALCGHCQVGARLNVQNGTRTGEGKAASIYQTPVHDRCVVHYFSTVLILLLLTLKFGKCLYFKKERFREMKLENFAELMKYSARNDLVCREKQTLHITLFFTFL